MSAKFFLVPGEIWGVMTVAQESLSEPYEGKVAVAEEILLRTKTKFYSSGTIQSTVLWPYQYSGWNTKDGARIYISELDLTHPKIIECYKAFSEAMNGSNRSLGATHHFAKTLNPWPSWASSPKMKFLTEIGNHRFYKEER